MIFHNTELPGVCLIEPEPRQDGRGFFARAFSRDEFAAAGLAGDFVQMNNSLSHARATLRGLHYQLPPAAEAKLVRCVRGALWDVALDLRPSSPAFGQWFAAELTSENRAMIHIPPGVAHGFITLSDETEAIYLVSAPHSPAHERGIRWNDPRFSIAWPLPPRAISDKDSRWPDFDPAFHAIAQLDAPP
jgi:dTDP-4-dehydrorhamnose 3,5-epimerase